MVHSSMIGLKDSDRLQWGHILILAFVPVAMLTTFVSEICANLCASTTINIALIFLTVLLLVWFEKYVRITIRHFSNPTGKALLGIVLFIVFMMFYAFVAGKNS